MLSREQMADIMFDRIFEQSGGNADLEREGLQKLVEQCLMEMEINIVDSLVKNYRPAWTVDEIPDLRSHKILVDHLYKPLPCDLQWLYSCLLAHPDTRSHALRQAGTKYPVEALGLTPGIQAPNLDLKWLRAPNINLSGANLSGANLEGSTLTNADLTKTNLSNARLQYANLRSADLTEADLTNADLTGADLSTAILTGAKLDGIKLRNTLLPNPDLPQSPRKLP